MLIEASLPRPLTLTGTICFFTGHHNSEHVNLSCYHLDECVGDSGVENRTQPTNHIQNTTGLLGGKRSSCRSYYTTFFIAEEIIAILGGSVNALCNILEILKLLIIFSFFVSLFYLVLISIERLIALKYPFRYIGIATKPRLALAVTCSWIIAGIYILLRTLTSSKLPLFYFPFLSAYLLYFINRVLSYFRLFYHTASRISKLRSRFLEKPPLLLLLLLLLSFFSF